MSRRRKQPVHRMPETLEEQRELTLDIAYAIYAQQGGELSKEEWLAEESTSNNDTESTNHQGFSTGAVRSADANDVRYDLISPIALEALARTYAEGATKYSDFNWEKGMPAHDILNHALRHIYKFLGGDRSEEHLAHAMWNLGAAIHSIELWPELNEGHLRQPGCLPPKETAK